MERTQALLPRGAAGGRASKEAPRIAFAATPLSGHLRLALALAQEMASRGFVVDLLVGTQGMAEEVQDELRAFQRRCPAAAVYALGMGRELATSVDWDRVAASSGRYSGSIFALMEELVAITGDAERLAECMELWRAMAKVLTAQRPHLVVTDHSLRLVQLWAEHEGIPTVIMHTPYFTAGAKRGCARMYPWHRAQLSNYLKLHQPWERLDERKEELGISSGMHIRLGDGPSAAQGAGGGGRGLAPHTLVFCEPELLNAAGVPPRVHVVGPCLTQDNEGMGKELQVWLDEARSQDQRVLYVSLGTLGSGFLTPAAARTLLDAVVGLGQGWRLLWSLPEAQQELLELCGHPLDPERVRVERYVLQRAVLEHEAVQLFITHGGQSSVNEAISAAVPLVCVPLFCDQYEVAEAVRQHGLGLIFHKDELLRGRHRRLTKMLLRIVNEPVFRGTARRHSDLMHLRSGCSRAALVLESIVRGGVDFQELWRGPPRDLAPGGLAGCLRGLGRLCGTDGCGGWSAALSRCLQGVPPVYSRACLRGAPAAGPKVPTPTATSGTGEPSTAALGGA